MPVTVSGEEFVAAVKGGGEIVIAKYGDNGPVDPGDDPIAAQVLVKLKSGSVAGNFVISGKKDKVVPSGSKFTEVLLDYEGQSVSRDEALEVILEAAVKKIFGGKKDAPHIGDCGSGIRFKAMPGTTGTIGTKLQQGKDLKPVPASLMEVPATVLVDCTVSVVYSKTAVYGMVTARSCKFIKKLGKGQFTQLNPLPDEPDDSADDFLADIEVDEMTADALAMASPGKRRAAGGSEGGSASKKSKGAK
jgi:hypothetical protein